MFIHHQNCPVCKSSKVDPLLTVKDHSVSGESFVIWQCTDCTLRFTQDAPAVQEIGPYYKSDDYISHTNTNKGMVNASYQRIRKFTLQQKAGLVISETRTSGKILDVGCGTGAFLSVMKEKGWAVTGIEPDDDARTIATQTFGVDPLPAEDFYTLPDDSFDAITLWHVLEHVHDLHAYMEKLRSMLKGKGKIFIAVPNYTSVDASIYGPFWAAYDVPRHLYHFSPLSVQQLAESHALRISKKKQMWFDSFYISLLSSKYRKGSTQYVNAMISGMRSNIKALTDTDRCSSLTYILEKV